MDFQNIKLIALFVEGILSFFSPCIIPIIPIYISMLAGKKQFDENGNILINKKNMITNSLFFVVGISITFFILAFATSYISTFLNTHIKVIQIISGILIIIMGFLQLGFLKLNFLKQEFSLKKKVKTKNMSPLVALIMGFTFSFSWTPCIGPILMSVFLYASTHTGILSAILVLVYSVGFILPFIIVAFFATKILDLIKKHNNILKYTMIISGIILVLIGLSILTGSFQTFVVKYFI